MKPITFIAATNNPGKLKEIQDILKTAGCGCISLREAGITIDIEETGTTFSENAYLKAKAIFDLCKQPVIADDSGLCVDYLNGAPGVLTARYAGGAHDNEANIDKLLGELDGVPEQQRTARFVSAICTILDAQTTMITKGWCEGFIGTERRGDGGFGYDPVFWLKGNHSFAQISAQRKNAISHRGRGIRKMAFLLRGVHRVKLG